MKYFTFYWIDGSKDVEQGNTVVEAFQRLGFGQGAISSLDFYDEGITSNWQWNDKEKKWSLITN